MLPSAFTVKTMGALPPHNPADPHGPAFHISRPVWSILIVSNASWTSHLPTYDAKVACVSDVEGGVGCGVAVVAEAAGGCAAGGVVVVCVVGNELHPQSSRSASRSKYCFLLKKRTRVNKAFSPISLADISEGYLILLRLQGYQAISSPDRVSCIVSW